MDTQPLHAAVVPPLEHQAASDGSIGATEVPSQDNNEEKRDGARRVLIVPKGHDQVIKEKMVNIFQARQPETGKGQAGHPVAEVGTRVQADLKAEDNSLGLNVKCEKWSKGHKEPRQVKPNADIPTLPEKKLQQPDGWGKTVYLQPDAQCPPKKRGPKAKPVDASEVEQPKPKAKAKGRARKNAQEIETLTQPEPEVPKTRKRGKSKPDGHENPDKQPEATENSSEGSTPNQRLQEHLQKAKDSKKRRNAQAENTTSAETAEEASSEALEASGEKSQVESRPEDTVVPADDAPKVDNKPAEANPPPAETKRKRASQKAADAPEDPADTAAAEKAAKKKRLSRKSSAYHAAFKACQGSLENKKAAAKKVF